jgi:U3 small nucleolar ribonucleoprotein protein IMP3
MRELKYHEKKLLRKVNLYSWKGDENIRVSKILRRYHISDRNDYATYSKLCGHITKLTAKLKTMDLKQCEDIGVSSFCRRRLPVVMVRMKMSETLKEAVTFIEQVSERSEASEPG